MKKITFLLCFCLWVLQSFAQETQVSGKVSEEGTQESMVGVSVLVKGTVVGTVTRADGTFSLKTSVPVPFTLVFSMVGYESQQVNVEQNNANIEVSLKEQILMTKEVVVSASRVEESIMRSSVTVEKLDILKIRNSAAMSFFDAIANQRGIDVMSSGMLIKSVNTRGFNTTVNRRFIQRIDGIEMQSPGFSIPLGNAFGASDLDIESVETIAGAASALYGASAFNGIMNMTTKNPFDYQGLSAQAKTGINHVGEATGAKPFYDVAVRYAKAINNKFAFKVNLSYMAAEDWYANDMTDLTPTAGVSGSANPAYNALHLYGDEAVVTRINNVPITRTGYADKDMLSNRATNFKSDISLHYKLNNKLEISYMFKFAHLLSPIKASNRYVFDVNALQHKLELKGSNFYVRAYTSMDDYGSEGGKSYDTRVLANNLNARYSPNATWGADYTAAFNGTITGYAQGNHADARRYADRNRLLPGTAAFEQAKSEIIKNQARIVTTSLFHHLEGQYDFSKHLKFAKILMGGHYRYYTIDSKGTNFNDGPTGKKPEYSEFGAFLQVSKSLLAEKLTLSASARYDKSQFFDGVFTPRVSAVYAPNEDHAFRINYQTGFRPPVIGEQFFVWNLGTQVAFGGAPGLLPGDPIHTNSYTVASTTAFTNAVNTAVGAGKTRDQAIQDNLGLLQKANIPFVKPETMWSYEVGYRGVFAKRLTADIAYSYSNFTNFIGFFAAMNTKSPINTLASGQDLLSNDPSRALRHIIYANSPKEVYSQNVSVDLNADLGKGFNLTANGTWMALYNREVGDAIVPAFNVPTYRFNIGLSNRKIAKNWGFSAIYRWQGEFDYQFPFFVGVAKVPAYSTIDAQVSYNFKKYLNIKLGGTNILNQYYIQAYGAPAIGAVYYLSLTFDELFR